MGFGSTVKEEWELFKADESHARFEHHRQRMAERSTKVKAVQVGLGAALVGGGVFFMIVPVPIGIVTTLLGLVLFTGASSHLARLFDRLDPPMQRWTAQLRRRWDRLPRPVKVVVVIVDTVVAVGVALLIWRWLT